LLKNKEIMKNLFSVLVVALIFVSCVKNELPISEKEEVYGSYLAIDTLQEIQLLNFSEPYIYLLKKDSTVVRHYNYFIFDNHCFDGEGNYIFEIVYLENRDLKIIDIGNNEILDFRNKY
tara:strand:- start:18253 stop:18609 length:357 start_codon:yes stop_codon:yes gene_type:complete